MKNIKKNKILSAREAAYYALLAWWKNAVFLADSFNEIRKTAQLDGLDLQLSQEIAFGVVRRFYTLDAIIKHFIKEQKIKLKPDAKLLLKMAIYQLVFMDKVPVYAVVFESVELSKKYCPYQTGFINGLLRKFTTLLPLKDLDKILAVEEFFSLPKEFIVKLQQAYPNEWKKLLENTICRPKMTYLYLKQDSPSQELKSVYPGKFLHYFPLKKDQQSQGLFQSKDIYVQNPTPGILMESLVDDAKPETILDLCSSPGGKLLIISKIFPNKKYHANEISADRIKRLQENLQKYEIKAECSIEDGTALTTKQKFDLIVIDAPCSNSGVLHKKPEAKFRLDEKSLEELEQTQFSLLQAATKYLQPHGQIWYLTCSILPEENEKMIQKFLQQNQSMVLKKSTVVLPDGNFFDGGFGASLGFSS